MKKAKKKAPKKTVRKAAKKPVSKATGPVMPLADKVVLRPLASEEKQRALALGIELPESANKDKSEQGTVIAVGPGRFEDGERVPMTVQVGDRVLFSKYGYYEVKAAAQEYLIVSESSILAIFQ